LCAGRPTSAPISALDFDLNAGEALRDPGPTSAHPSPGNPGNFGNPGPASGDLGDLGRTSGDLGASSVAPGALGASAGAAGLRLLIGFADGSWEVLRVNVRRRAKGINVKGPRPV